MSIKIISSVTLALFMAIGPVYAGASQTDPMTEAAAAWKEGKFDQAEEAFKRAIAADPEASLPYARLAAFYLSRQRAGDAIAQYQEAITRDPKNARLFVGIAVAYLHEQAYGMARAMVDQAVKLDPALANAKKLRDYVDAKERLLAKAHVAGQPGVDHKALDKNR